MSLRVFMAVSIFVSGHFLLSNLDIFIPVAVLCFLQLYGVVFVVDFSCSTAFINSCVFFSFSPAFSGCLIHTLPLRLAVSCFFFVVMFGLASFFVSPHTSSAFFFVRATAVRCGGSFIFSFEGSDVFWILLHGTFFFFRRNFVRAVVFEAPHSSLLQSYFFLK